LKVKALKSAKFYWQKPKPHKDENRKNLRKVAKVERKVTKEAKALHRLMARFGLV
jgi:hypothetical protein